MTNEYSDFIKQDQTSDLRSALAVAAQRQPDTEAQLQKLAQRGSRRARAELEGRMRATAPVPAPRTPPSPAANIPTLTVRANAASVRPAMPPMPSAGALPIAAADDWSAFQAKLAAIAEAGGAYDYAG